MMKTAVHRRLITEFPLLRECKPCQNGRMSTGLYHKLVESTLTAERHACMYVVCCHVSIAFAINEYLADDHSSKADLYSFPIYFVWFLRYKRKQSVRMERNYKEDQANEVEALDSIYCGEMESQYQRIVHYRTHRSDHCST